MPRPVIMPSQIIKNGVVYNFADKDVFELIWFFEERPCKFGYTIPQNIYRCKESGKFFRVYEDGSFQTPGDKYIKEQFDDYHAPEEAYMNAGFELKPYDPNKKWWQFWK